MSMIKIMIIVIFLCDFDYLYDYGLNNRDYLKFRDYSSLLKINFILYS